MHTEFANQEIARLQYAQVLRESARRPVVDKIETETGAEPAHTLTVRALRLLGRIAVRPAVGLR